MKELVWKTSEGKAIPISKLEDSHIVNIYRMRQRWAKRRKKKLVYDNVFQAVILEGKRRGLIPIYDMLSAERIETEVEKDGIKPLTEVIEEILA